jgi:hypothetical protein
MYHAPSTALCSYIRCRTGRKQDGDLVGDWVDEVIGRWWIGGFIALLIGSAVTLWITKTAPEVGRMSVGG